MRPLVSVVCPYWNQPHLISNAILSILNQTMKEWELIIVDDGSDGNEIDDIVKRFDDKRIKLVRLQHNGLVAARNSGNELAEAEYIIIQDSDDLSLPDRLEKCWDAKTDADVIVHGAYRNMWDAHWGAIHREYIPIHGLNLGRLIKEQHLPGWPMFKKSLWEKKPFRMETQFAYDWMMFLDWALSGAKFYCLNEGLYEYVRHENSASQVFEKSGLRAKSMKRIQEIIKAEYPDQL